MLTCKIWSKLKVFPCEVLKNLIVRTFLFPWMYSPWQKKRRCRKLSDKTQPNDTWNCRTVSVSNIFLRPKKVPPPNRLSTATVPVAYPRPHREEQRAASQRKIPTRCEGAPFALSSFVDEDETSSRQQNFGSFIFHISSFSFFVPIKSNLPPPSPLLLPVVKKLCW